MRAKRHELVTALVHSTGMLARAMCGGIQAEREVADLARRGEDDRLNLRADLEREEGRRKRAEDRVAELETCYKNATETIQRQADRLSGTAYLPTDEALAAVRKERDDALLACEAAEKEAEALRGGNRERLLTAARERAQAAEDRVTTQAGYIAEYSGIVERLRTGAREALEALLDNDSKQWIHRRREAVSALNFALEPATATDATLHGGSLADALETCRQRKHEVEELARTCADLRKARDGHQEAALRSAERMAAAADALYKVRSALRPGPGTIPDGIDKALGLLTGSDLPPMLDAEDEAARSRGEALMRARDHRVEADFPKVVVGGVEQ